LSLPSRSSWRVARRYARPPLLLGALLAAARQWRAAIPLLAAGAAVSLFFRDPPRRLVPAPDLAYAVADGYVTLVEENASTPWAAGPGTRISTFLSIHNVHIPRTPLAGMLEDWQWVDGKSRAALSSRAAEENRQARLLIVTPDGDDARVVLAAGMIARRITAWAEPGDKLSADRGEMSRLGVIHFGSRADLLLPPRWVPLVRRGQRVRAGITPVARKMRSGPGRGAGPVPISWAPVAPCETGPSQPSQDPRSAEDLPGAPPPAQAAPRRAAGRAGPELTRVRPETERAILALTIAQVRPFMTGNAGGGRLTEPAAPVLALVDEMVALGWPKAWIAREIGTGQGRAMRVGRTRRPPAASRRAAGKLTARMNTAEDRGRVRQQMRPSRPGRGQPTAVRCCETTNLVCRNRGPSPQGAANLPIE
jgi:phosphatidylserine decarboxylase